MVSDVIIYEVRVFSCFHVFPNKKQQKRTIVESAAGFLILFLVPCSLFLAFLPATKFEDMKCAASQLTDSFFYFAPPWKTGCLQDIIPTEEGVYHMRACDPLV